MPIQTIPDLFANKTVQHQPTQKYMQNTPIAQLAASALAHQIPTQRYVNRLDQAAHAWITELLTGNKKDVEEDKRFQTTVQLDKQEDEKLAEVIRFRLEIQLRYLGFTDIEVPLPTEDQRGLFKITAMLPPVVTHEA